MTFSLTLDAWQLGILLASVILFIGALVLSWSQGLFDGPDTYGIGLVFTVAIFSVIWAIPSLVLWAIWATWIKS